MFFQINKINANDNTNLSLLEIVSSDSSLGVLKQTDFQNHLLMYLPLQLSFGDLKSLKKYDRSCLKKIFPKEDYYPFREEFLFQEEIEELNKYVSNAEKIRIWSSRKNADEYLLFLYICSLFPGKKMSVVFADEYNPYCWSISCMDAREVNKLGKKEHILSSLEKQNYRKLFQEIVNINSELRYMKDGKLESIPVDYFDEKILSYLKKLGTVSELELIAKLMINFVMDSTGYFQYRYLINRMIEKKKITVVGTNEKGKRIIKVAD